MKILVTRMDLLGDAIVTSAFLETLHNVFDNCSVDILCHGYNSVAFTSNIFVNNCYILKDHVIGAKKNAPSFDELCKKINNYVYDLLLVLHGDITTYRYALKINAKEKFFSKFQSRSFKKNTWMVFSRLYNVKYFPNLIQEEHEVERLHRFLDFVLAEISMKIEYCIPKTAKFFLPDYNSTDSKTIIPNSVIINISGKEYRYLNDAMIFSLLFELIKFNKSIGIICTKNDIARLNKILLYLPKFEVEIICHDDIFEIALNISHYKSFIGCDGGMVHLAAGLGLYVIAIFHDQVITKWHPWTDACACVQASNKNIYDVSYLSIMNEVDNYIFKVV